jgi:type I restriction enzyme S subunit
MRDRQRRCKGRDVVHDAGGAGTAHILDVRGADGTQLLQPRSDIDSLYFFYACRDLDLPSRGYNRHFTTLKEKSLALAPYPEQVEIGVALRRVEDAIALQAKELLASNALKRAAMRELFTRGTDRT